MSYRLAGFVGRPAMQQTHLNLAVEPDGSLRLRSGAQRFNEGPIACRFPMLFSGRADLRESWDPDAEVFRISLEVTNHYVSFLFGYEGWLRATYATDETARNRLKPRRHERWLDCTVRDPPRAGGAGRKPASIALSSNDETPPCDGPACGHCRLSAPRASPCRVVRALARAK